MDMNNDFDLLAIIDAAAEAPADNSVRFPVRDGLFAELHAAANERWLARHRAMVASLADVLAEDF